MKKHLEEMDIDEKEYSDPHGPRRGKPAQGEVAALSFFPKLSSAGGYQVLSSGQIYKIEWNNRIDIYAIDLRIIRIINGTKKIVGWLDVERRDKNRGAEWPFTQTWCDVNVPLHSHRSNWGKYEQDRKPISGKVRHFRNYPKNSFYLILRHTALEGICMWAEDIINSPIEWQKTCFGGDNVYKVPRDKTYSSKIHEFEIEDFVMEKLIEGGFVK